jgi:hypothetical protein
MMGASAILLVHHLVTVTRSPINCTTNTTFQQPYVPVETLVPMHLMMPNSLPHDAKSAVTSYKSYASEAGPLPA